MFRWLEHTMFAGNSLLMWTVALGGALLGFMLLAGLLRLLSARVRRRHAETGRPALALLLALLGATRYWLLLLLALAIACRSMDTNATASAWLEHLLFALSGLQLALWANALIRHWLQRAGSKGGKRVNPVFLNVITWGAQTLVWSMLLLAFMANVGINITAFVASLGVGGIAVALGLQNILGDLFASVAIGLDKPFEVGDSIAFGDDSGTVVDVGVKTTRIAATSGEQLVISNANLLKELIHNFSRMSQRRVVFGFRVPYGTRSDQVQTIVARTREFIQAETRVRFDRGHLTRFGEYGYDFEFVYYVLSPDYTLYCDIQQRVNLQIMELLEAMQVPFAIPARSVFPHPGTPAAEPVPEVGPD
ncbi:MAG: mechanosensitive ion channel family protein [Xanthomonadales bacterium]|nr:mechanosensitive ion channel family protein [Xanthomonadales bacterium]